MRFKIGFLIFFKAILSYDWSNRRSWFFWLKNDFKRLYYQLRFNIKMGKTNGTVLPNTGKGLFVSVYSKGQIIQMIDESGRQNEIRIIPLQYNHGIAVESWKEGKLLYRNMLEIKHLNDRKLYSSDTTENLMRYKFEKDSVLRNNTLHLLRRKKRNV